MLRTLRTDSSNTDFQQLVTMLDADLKIRDGADHDFYHQFNTITHIRNAVVAYMDDKPVACGSFKEYSDCTVEIKRMYVKPEHRGRGIASTVLDELEKWAAELQNKTCILETGKKQPEAIRLYEKSGYIRIPNFGQYANVENSVCMQKDIQLKMQKNH